MLISLGADANGRTSMVKERSAEAVISALSDPTPEVRSNVYDALLNFSAIHSGSDALVEAGYCKVLVENSTKESNDDVRHLPLLLLHNCVKGEKGLNEALENNAVEACIEVSVCE